VIRNKPKLTVPDVLRIPPQDSSPELVGAEADGIVEHIDGGSKLLPKTCSPIDNHFVPPQKRLRLFSSPTARVTGGWGQKGLQTENCQSSEKSLKTRRVPPAGCTLE